VGCARYWHFGCIEFLIVANTLLCRLFVRAPKKWLESTQGAARTTQYYMLHTKTPDSPELLPMQEIMEA
jgi:hypothetical protein